MLKVLLVAFLRADVDVEAVHLQFAAHVALHRLVGIDLHGRTVAMAQRVFPHRHLPAVGDGLRQIALHQGSDLGRHDQVQQRTAHGFLGVPAVKHGRTPVPEVDAPLGVVALHRDVGHVFQQPAKPPLALDQGLLGLHPLGHVVADAFEPGDLPARVQHRVFADLDPVQLPFNVTQLDAVRWLAFAPEPVFGAHPRCGVDRVVGAQVVEQQRRSVRLPAVDGRRRRAEIGHAPVAVVSEEKEVGAQRLDQPAEVGLALAQALFGPLARGDVLVRARHDHGGAVFVALDHPAAGEHPDPVPLAVAHAHLGLVGGQLAGQVGLHQRAGALEVVQVGQPFPGLDGDGFKLLQRVAQHLGPLLVDVHLTAVHPPDPGAGGRAFHDDLQPRPLALQRFAVAHVGGDVGGHTQHRVGQAVAALEQHLLGLVPGLAAVGAAHPLLRHRHGPAVRQHLQVLGLPARRHPGLHPEFGVGETDHLHDAAPVLGRQRGVDQHVAALAVLGEQCAGHEVDHLPQLPVERGARGLGLTARGDVAAQHEGAAFVDGGQPGLKHVRLAAEGHLELEIPGQALGGQVQKPGVEQFDHRTGKDIPVVFAHKGQG